ncbi:Protein DETOXIFICATION 43 [Glycine max]|nr:Protein DETOXIFICATION 43 [Glycine max]KAH1222994.1 Protein DETOXIFICATION 43 [Glycine max]
MDENGCSNEPNNKWKMPLFVFFRDARNVSKLDALSREILGIAFPSALAIAADPIASLIDTAFIGHLGSVELAAAGVSIVLFNQASRITIFPLVSIITSFVAEEDTIEKMNTKATQNGNKTKFSEAIVPEDHMLQDIENIEAPTESMEEKDEPKEYVENNVTGNNDIKNGDGGNANICKFWWVTSSMKSKEKLGKKKRHIASASTALLFGTILGLIQAAVLIFATKPLLGVMGVKRDSPMLNPAEKYLRLRSFGAPAVLLSLAMQGIFGGFKDTATPLYVIVSGYSLNVILDPILIFTLKLGIEGAAIAHVLSQYMMAFTLLLILMKKVHLLPPSIKDLQIFRFLKNGGFLMLRVIAVTFCVTLAASLASRLGSIPMAAFQTCLQVWLTSSLLADGLAVAVQSILACSFAEKDHKKTTAAATRTLQMSFVLGVGLSLAVGLGLYFGAGVFSRNVHVVHLIKIGIPFVAATQPINSLAFVFDGVNYGSGVTSKCSYRTPSLQDQTFRWDLDCTNHLYDSSHDGNWDRTLALSKRWLIALRISNHQRNFVVELIFKLDALSREILGIAFPAALAVVADPIASLIDTTFIGHLGPVELAAAGVSIALFNQASRITIFPLVSITTSFVAEEDTIQRLINKETETDNIENETITKENVEAPKKFKGETDESNNVVAKSTFTSGDVEKLATGNMGINNENVTSSTKSKPKVGKKRIASASTALLFGTILGLLQTAILTFAAKPLLYAMGLKHDSPMLIPAEKYLRLRSIGSPAVLLSLAMQGIFRGFKDTTTPLYVIGGLLLTRVVSVTFCMTLAASLAARLGSIPMAAFQPGLQIWLASSLLADGLAVAVQTMLACSFAEKDYNKATAAATRTLQMSFVLGVGLSFAVALGLYFGPGIFSKNANVVHLIKISMPVCPSHNKSSMKNYREVLHCLFYWLKFVCGLLILE